MGEAAARISTDGRWTTRPALSRPSRLILGLGANLGDPPATFLDAMNGLREIAPVLAVSHLYRTVPQGPRQPRYWNMAVLIGLGAPLIELLDHCQALERRAGRCRSNEVHWGPRVLDIDLLIGPRLIHRGPRLELPHPRLLERPFALAPAAELAPEWRHPLRNACLLELAKTLPANGPGSVIRIEPAARPYPQRHRPVAPELGRLPSLASSKRSA